MPKTLRRQPLVLLAGYSGFRVYRCSHFSGSAHLGPLTSMAGRVPPNTPWVYPLFSYPTDPSHRLKVYCGFWQDSDHSAFERTVLSRSFLRRNFLRAQEAFAETAKKEACRLEARRKAADPGQQQRGFAGV